MQQTPTTFYDTELTPICTTKFIAFAQRYQDFRDRNTELLGLSIDSNSSHIAWIINIFRNTGIEIPFPIIEDRDMAIARMYGMIQPSVSATETVRSTFIIDPNGVVRAILVYPLTNGRNIGEILRLLDALQTTDAQGVVTPANGRSGYPAVLPRGGRSGEREAGIGRELHGLVSVLYGDRTFAVAMRGVLDESLALLS